MKTMLIDLQKNDTVYDAKRRVAERIESEYMRTIWHDATALTGSMDDIKEAALMLFGFRLRVRDDIK